MTTGSIAEQGPHAPLVPDRLQRIDVALEIGRRRNVRVRLWACNASSGRRFLIVFIVVDSRDFCSVATTRLVVELQPLLSVPHGTSREVRSLMRAV